MKFQICGSFVREGVFFKSGVLRVLPSMNHATYKKIVCGSLSRTKDYSYGHVHQQSSNYSKTMCCVTKQLQKLTFAE